MSDPSVRPDPGRSMSAACPGTQGYDEGTALGYERLRFEDVHPRLAGLLPGAPVDVLDVGSGSGRDAAHLAGLGHRVVAVEPHGPYRRLAAALHPHPGIRWVDDALPDLARVSATGRRFSLVMLSAVWMHLSPSQRGRAMPRLAGLLRPDGVLYVLTRHGPTPPGRLMYPVDPAETAEMAGRCGLSLLAGDRSGDLLGRADVTWSWTISAGPAYRPQRAVADEPCPEAVEEGGGVPSP